MNHTAIQYVDWGLIEYHNAWKQQEQLFNAMIEDKINNRLTHNYLVFCEHPHVFTLGKSGDEHNLLVNLKQLKQVQFVRTDRGGDITYHGPGQLVGYPIFDLANFGLGLKSYVHNIEECIIELLHLYDIEAFRLNGATGVWLDVGNTAARKICAIGVKSSRYITMHGFALNVNTELNYFNYINPCGFVDKGVTSMANELGKPVDMELLKYQLKEIIKKKFSVE